MCYSTNADHTRYIFETLKRETKTLATMKSGNVFSFNLNIVSCIVIPQIFFMRAFSNSMFIKNLECMHGSNMENIPIIAMAQLVKAKKAEIIPVLSGRLVKLAVWVFLDLFLLIKSSM